MSEWISVKDRLPEAGEPVLGWSSADGDFDIVEWSLGKEDAPDDMGHDSGFIGFTCFPGRSFGNPDYYSEARSQPTHWMPLPESPNA